jgi:hypothetical protein
MVSATEKKIPGTNRPFFSVYRLVLNIKKCCFAADKVGHTIALIAPGHWWTRLSW